MKRQRQDRDLPYDQFRLSENRNPALASPSRLVTAAAPKGEARAWSDVRYAAAAVLRLAELNAAKLPFNV